MEFKTKVIVITGASSGIGAATAVRFAKLGGLLTLVGRNLEKLNETAEKCLAENGQQALVVKADVTNEEDVKLIVDQTLEKYGRIDVLINNAGIIENGSIEETNLTQYDRVMGTNVRSIYQLTMLTVPHLVKSKGNIVSISSVCGLRAFPGLVAYNMSKSAVDQFTKCVALELAPKGVRVNSVNPGVIVTELHKRGGMDEETYKNFLEKCKQTHALQRPGNVDEVAAAITFLASDSASFITGVNLPVDGGRHAMCPR
ncbi:meso-2,3-butanediol dehydrogenase-like [Eupeodes corollae]|uniref:meso-2,3-butanediol dehydrogenase-like n=1 Tax=Eupeodes corollae TaxID=290404 RepID=UPI002491D9D3|nr:meso-2,3-butanediol dehydrogenase-like [Eupeodes corollae]